MIEFNKTCIETVSTLTHNASYLKYILKVLVGEEVSSRSEASLSAEIGTELNSSTPKLCLNQGVIPQVNLIQMHSLKIRL